MNVQDILTDLEKNGSPATKKILTNHGAHEPFYGVKVEYLKKWMKILGKNYQLSMDLWNTGVSDAMYLAGLISDPSGMSKKDLHHWAHTAYWYMLSEYSVAWTASEHPDGWELALEWIDSDKEQVQCAGWSTLHAIISIQSNEDLPISQIQEMLLKLPSQIQAAHNRTRYCMNMFVICVGSYIPELTSVALETAAKMGKITVSMGNTACKVPDAASYISKIESMGRIGKKRKTARC